MSVPIGLKKAAVLCILRSEAGFLLLCRSKEPNLGKYTPVGGHLEPFETPRTAVIREVKEETGISIEEPRLRGILTETSPTEYNWIIYIYTADITTVPPVECAEGTLEWVAQERLDTIPTPTTDRFIYDYLSRSEFFVFDAVYDENVRLITLVDELSGRVLFGGSSTDQKEHLGHEIQQPLLPKGTIFLEVDAERKKGVSAEAKGLFMVAEGTQRTFIQEERPAVTTVIEVELPFHIRGLSRTTAIHAHVDGVDYGIALQTKQRPDQIRRYFWGKDGLGVDIQTELPLDMEDRWGRALYTLATITFPFFIDLAVEQDSAEQLFEREEQALRAVCKVLNFFIENYVYHARYFHLRRLCIHDIDKYSFWHLYNGKAYNVTHCFLRSLIHMGETPKLQKPVRILDVGTTGKLIVNAWQSYEYEDYHLAVVNAVIALEVTLAEYKKRTRKLRRPGSILLRGKPEKCLDTLASHVPDQSLIGLCKEGLTIRHKVVHEGLREVDPTIARNVVNSIQTVCGFINNLKATTAYG